MKIADMNVQCSYKVSHLDSPYTAMSDCCCRTARSGVRLMNGNVMWRCIDHTGLIDGGIHGPVVMEIDDEDKN